MTKNQIEIVTAVMNYLYEYGDSWFGDLLSEVLEEEKEKTKEPAAASSSGDPPR